MKKSILAKHPGMSSKRLRRETKEKVKISGRKTFKDIFRRLTGAIFSQISKDGKFAGTNLKEGVKRHGNKSIDALLIELSQLDNMVSFTPLKVEQLSKRERKWLSISQ